MFTIAIAGNPNSGKSSLFNLLTGGKQKVGNWPGVTVDKKVGKIKYKSLEADLIDMPGIYALSAWSEDERIARDYLISSEANLLLNVVNSTNLERDLFLTYLLKALGIPMLVILNMADIAKKQGIKIDLEKFEKEIGVPVIAVSATEKMSKKILLEKIAQFKNCEKSGESKLPPDNENEYEILAENTYKQIENLMANSVKKGVYVYSGGDKIDKIVTNKFLGFPIFLAAMYLLFWLTINIGNIFIDLIERAFAHVSTDIAILNGVLEGTVTLLTFIPIIFTMFFLIGILESSGYMARVAFVVDKLMRLIGLPGKAFIPLLIGFGCSVPAFIATRTLENRRDRILSVFMIPFMSCGARLPVYVLFAAVFFPDNGTNIIFAIYLIGMILALITGILLKKSVYKGTLSPFIMELPQYHIPSVKVAFNNALWRIKAFLKKGVRVLIPIIFILSVLNSVGVLETAGKFVSPVFEPIGIEEENWAASVSLFAGIAAKEAIIGSMGSLSKESFHNSQIAAFAFLLFVLLYVPCISALYISAKEVGWVPVILQASYSTVLGWCLATLFYQCFEGGSLFYIILSLVIFISFTTFTMWYARISGKFK